MSTIEITNCGPVEHVSIPVPDAGGIVVLRGRNGRGKTKTLEAVESAITGRGKIEVRDGALNGKVDAFGVTLKVGRSTRRAGELEITSLEGRLSVNELVDPGMKSPDAADAKRIKALVQLANVLPSAELFYPLVGGRDQFEQLVGTTALASDDLVTMADRIKRDLEKAARNEESQAEHAEGRARGAREAAAGVDLNQVCDSSQLQSNLEAAIKREAELNASAEHSSKQKGMVAKAQKSLEEAEIQYHGLTVGDATRAEVVAAQEVEATTAAMKRAEEVWRQAKAENESARNAYAHAITARKNAEQHEAMIAQWREQLATQAPEGPSEETIAKAREQVQQARQAVEQGALIRQAKQHLDDAAKHAGESVKHTTRAVLLRDAAKGTDEILSGVVAKSGSPLRVEAGRLVLNTKRGATYFADLSAGERWKLALDIAIDAVGEKGVLTINQEAWEALDPHNRRSIAEHVQGRGVLILTAECSDDEEITAKVFE